MGDLLIHITHDFKTLKLHVLGLFQSAIFFCFWHTLLKIEVTVGDKTCRIFYSSVIIFLKFSSLAVLGRNKNICPFQMVLERVFLWWAHFTLIL